MSQNNRPLSPHLEVYKLPLTGIISITHRMTGVVLAMGLLLYVSSFYIVLQGEQVFIEMQSILNFTVSYFFSWIFIYALFFHLCHGIRHLIWDVGAGFDKDSMNKNAIIELILSLVLTLIFY